MPGAESNPLTLTRRYVCIRAWNSKGSLPSLVTTRLVDSEPGERLTL